MYFSISKLHGWGKRFDVQPQTIDSEFPRPHLKTGRMTNSVGFLFCASHFSAGILDVFQGKMGRHRAKKAAAWAF